MNQKSSFSSWLSGSSARNLTDSHQGFKRNKLHHVLIFLSWIRDVAVRPCNDKNRRRGRESDQRFPIKCQRLFYLYQFAKWIIFVKSSIYENPTIRWHNNCLSYNFKWRAENNLCQLKNPDCLQASCYFKEMILKYNNWYHQKYSTECFVTEESN